MDIQVFQQQDNYNSQHSNEQKNNTPAKVVPNLSITEYEYLAQRLEESFKNFTLISDAFATPENLGTLKPEIERRCGKITLRVKVLKEQRHSNLG